jgi:ribosomal protein S18 acetylase RimI-like enzyme
MKVSLIGTLACSIRYIAQSNGKVMRPGEAASLNVVWQLTEGQLQDLHALYQNEWWTRNRTLEETRKVVDGSQICLGLVDSSDKLVGFGRVLTDFMFKALIFDVIVAPDYRGIGLGDNLVSLITGHEKLRDVKSFELYCLPELVPFYERHGFSGDVGNVRLMRCTVA